MNLDRFLFTLYAVCGGIILTALGAAFTLSNDLTVPIGVAVGSALGIVPIASWHLIVKLTDGFSRKNRIPLAIGIGVGKYAVLGVGLYLLIRHDLVNVWAFLGGSAIIIPVLLVLGMRVKTGDDPARGAS
jgi:hypothetical protein